VTFARQDVETVLGKKPESKNHREDRAMTMNKSRMWKDGARRGIVYVEEREAAEKVMALRGATNRLRRTASLRHAAASTASLAGRPRCPRRCCRRRGRSRGPRGHGVYLDRKGKPFAWQIPFAMEDWERVTALVGAQAATV
jgi:hypothetical protein